MPTSSLLRDKVTLVKKDGSVFSENIAASVQGQKIFIMDVKLPIEVDDHILRQIPSGLSEDYIVLDPNFRSGGSLSHWELIVRRTNQPAASPQTIINNITGNNSRVNINSTDNSKNQVIQNSEQIFRDLAQALQQGISQAAERDQLISLVQAMEAGTKDGSFKEKYRQFIESAANHITLVAPFLPALTKLL